MFAPTQQAMDYQKISPATKTVTLSTPPMGNKSRRSVPYQRSLSTPLGSTTTAVPEFKRRVMALAMHPCGAGAPLSSAMQQALSQQPHTSLAVHPADITARLRQLQADTRALHDVTHVWIQQSLSNQSRFKAYLFRQLHVSTFDDANFTPTQNTNLHALLQVSMYTDYTTYGGVTSVLPTGDLDNHQTELDAFTHSLESVMCILRQSLPSVTGRQVAQQVTRRISDTQDVSRVALLRSAYKRWFYVSYLELVQDSVADFLRTSLK